jgi:hypothetical protein
MADHIAFTPTPGDMAAAAAAMRPPGSIGWPFGRRWQQDDPRLAAREFFLRDDGFETSGAGFRTEIDWTAVTEIVDRGGTILFITEWKETFFIPRRVFAAPGAADAFVQRARDLWSARWDAFNAGDGEADPAPQHYRLTYRLDRADIAAFAGLRRELRGWRKFLFFLPAIVLGGAYGWFRDSSPAVSAFLDSLGAWTIFIVIALVGIWYVIVTLTMSLWRAVQVRRAALPAGETTLVADEAGIAASADGKEQHHQWRDVPAVTLGPAHVFLLTAPERAIIVPLRAFTNRTAMIRFYDFAEEASKHAEA